jgi:hypothetical protein
MNLPAYHELHVISDLHMGGDRPEFQILRETTRLASDIRWVGAQQPDGRVALVLNGDVVDTLAEEVGGYVATDTAVTTIERIMNDASFSRVWSALSDSGVVGALGRIEGDDPVTWKQIQRFVRS